MYENYAIKMTSKESASIDSVKQNTFPHDKKNVCKINEAKKGNINQSAMRESFERRIKNKKCVLKYENNTGYAADCILGNREILPKGLHQKKFELKAINYEENHENIFKKTKEKASKVKSTMNRDEKELMNSLQINFKSMLHSNIKEKGERLKIKSLKQNDTFPCYIPKTEVNELLKSQSPVDVQYVEGYLRVNPLRYKYAYLPTPDEQCDLLIVGLRNRNRAFDGDLVVASINSPEKWLTTQEKTQKTGVIVCIKQKVHPRKTVGCFKQQNGYMLFHPRDQRVPLIKIHKMSLDQFTVCPSTSQDILYLAVITDWPKPRLAVGKIEKLIGSIGDIKAEAEAILLEQYLDVTPYSQDVIKGLPNSDYCLSENDVKDREDWRQECIFTIDPDTAVDLDDAVSCKVLENGNYEIGVHISDVTHYLEFLSPLDIQVSKRATTVYVTDNVYHMLPKQLCQVCSLLPGQDRLAFSVIWEIKPDAEIINSRFAKTVINSCCQMAYQHAQKFIENPQSSWPNDFLNITGNFTITDLSERVNILHDLASQMRSKRFQNGALQIGQPKLHVTIDRVTGLPVSYNIEEQQDSNRLIEEFMLLANMTVATQLYNTIPETALLRNHVEPSKQLLNKAKETLQKFGIHIDIESAGSLHASIKRYEEEFESENDELKVSTKYRMMIINTLCSKAMNRATYKCSSAVKTKTELKHYALNASLYTHFTSPIRRYSDCVVHRLLYSTITKIALPDAWCKKLCNQIATNCNLKKYSAKVAQEQSSKLYFTYLIDIQGPIVTMGIVLDVSQYFIEVILCQVGIKLKISFKQLKKRAAIKYSLDWSVPSINISWKQPIITQVINVFTLLYVRVEKHPESFQLIGYLLPPNQET